MASEIEITDGKIIVRPCIPMDADNIYIAVCESMAEVSKWAPWCHPGYSMSDCKSWLQSRALAWSDGKEYDFVILDARDRAFLGGCALYDHNRTHNFASIGYWVRTNRTGQGIASSAVRLIAKFGFESLVCSRLEIVVAVENMASQRVAEKVGGIREGILRNRHFVHDKLYDAIMFSLLPKDLEY